MFKFAGSVCSLASVLFVAVPAVAASKPDDGAVKVAGTRAGILWSDPGDISSRNLIYGIGGKNREPLGPFTFVKEDLDGTNPKFVVTDGSGAKWKVKLGAEAQPETAAARLVWAAGYQTNEDYFLPTIQVSGLPAHLKRGQGMVHPGGSFLKVRLKREEKKEEKKVAIWKWRDNPYSGTRELNGLRVMMALINNWDLKDVNNAVYQEGKTGEKVYMVSDLGASFGSTGLGVSHDGSKGNLHTYSHSKWISRTTPTYVSFNVPTRPAMITVFNPHEFFSRLNLRWIGRQIPLEDAKWMGDILGRLSPGQIRDSFRSAGYSPEDVDGFSTVVERRIADLRKL